MMRRRRGNRELLIEAVNDLSPWRSLTAVDVLTTANLTPRCVFVLLQDLDDIEDENEQLKQENKTLLKVVGQLTR